MKLITDKKFTLTFLASVALFGWLYILIFSYINPKQTMNLFGETQFEPYNTNFIYNKVKKMEEGGVFDTLIVGSSTSENFKPADVDFHLGGKSFTASTGGGNTPTRLALLNAGLKNFNLKRIVYIVDLFEFNKPKPSDDVIYNDKLREYAEILPEDYNLKRKFHHIFSNQSFEANFNVFKKFLKKSPTRINPDGTTERSMILSPVKSSGAFNSTINEKQKVNLTKQIIENYTTYSKAVLNNFDSLSLDVISYFDFINSKAKEAGVEIIYILSPYHHDFRQMLFQDPRVKERYQEWRKLFQGYAKKENILVYDSLDSFISTNPMSGVWRDGIHYSRESASHMLKEISQE